MDALLENAARLGTARGFMLGTASEIEGYLDTLTDRPKDEAALLRIAIGLKQLVKSIRAKDAELDAGRQS